MFCNVCADVMSNHQTSPFYLVQMAMGPKQSLANILVLKFLILLVGFGPEK